MKSSWISVRAVLEAAELAGVARERLREAAGIDIADTQDAYGWVDGARYDALLCSAVELTGSATFGLRWGESSPMVQYELLPLLAASGPNLRTCLGSALALQSILHEKPQMELRIEEELALVRCTPAPEMSPLARRVICDLSLAGVKRLIDYTTRGAILDRVSYALAYEADPDADEYRARFGAGITFGAAHSEVRLPAKLLDTDNPLANLELYRALEQQLTLLRTRMTHKLTYVEQVKLELRASLPRLLEMTDVAHALGMSERSLRRRLSDEGTSYSEVVEAAQIELAQQLLSDPRASVKAVAFELGFDTTSGFRRAFKRWTGGSPAGFRPSRA
jgi:AraC-like DNA-binding protein